MSETLEELLQRIAELEVGPSTLARLSGVNKSTISRILRRETANPRPDTMAKLSRAVDLHPQLPLPLEDQIVNIAKQAFGEQLRQIGVELARKPRPSEIEGVAGLYLLTGRGERRLFQRVFRLPEKLSA